MSDVINDWLGESEESAAGHYIGLDRKLPGPPRVDFGTTEISSSASELIEMLAEEAGEIVQAAMKIARHGFSSVNPTISEEKQLTNRQQLETEVMDLLAIVHLLRRSGVVDMNFAQLSPHQLDHWAEAKLKYTHHQQTLVSQLRARREEDPTLRHPTDFLNDRGS